MSHHIAANARENLATRLRGTVVVPADPGYDGARAAWNLAVDQRPAVIVRAADDTDVAAAIRFAADHDLGVAVQATGHGVARPADDALLLLTEGMDGVQVDAAARIAHIEAGVQWGRVLEKSSPDGLAPLLGSSPGVGAIGYTLGGGLGWLARRYGLAADSVRAFDLVAADGRRVRADPDEHRELFWGLRGGGAGSLGVITAMEVRLFPVGRVYGGNLLYAADLARDVAARYAEWIDGAPEDMTSSLVLMNFPPFDMVPEPLRGRSFAIVRGCHTGPAAEAEEHLRFWRDWRPPEIDMFGPMPFSAAATISSDPVDPLPAGSTTEWLRALSPEVIDIIVNQAFPTDGPPQVLMTEVRHVGGAVGRPSPEDAAYGNRDASLLLEAVSAIPGPEARDALQTHFARLREALRPHTTGGAYLNFLEGTDRVTRTRQGFTADAYRRLQALKRLYDPRNLFRYGFDLLGG